MRKIIRVILVLILISAILKELKSDIPQKIYYDGFLVKKGIPVSSYTAFEFRITNQDGTEEYWSSGSTTIYVSNGMFRYPLGVPPGDTPYKFSEIDWESGSKYLEITVDGVTLLPRMEMLSEAYALNADKLDGRDYDAFVSTQGDTMSGDLDLGNNNIINLANPINPQDVATKNYVDGKVSDVAYSSSTWDGVTDVAPSKNAVCDYVENNVNKIIMPLFQNGVNGFVATWERWLVLSSDNDAGVRFTFIIPETRNDWKLTFVSQTSATGGSQTNSGLLYVGKNGDGDSFSYNNIFNALNFDLVHSGDNIVTYTSSGTFSAEKGQYLYVAWNKDSDDGSGNLWLCGIYLTHD